MADNSSSQQSHPQLDIAAWKAVLEKYQKPSTKHAIWQIVNTLVPYAFLWYLMYLCLLASSWLFIPLALLAGALLLRVFIIFHDCGHGSFFESRVANDIVGFIAGLLTFTPYHHWRKEHAMHHGSSSNLDRRGTGDIWTMTVKEYMDAPWWKKFCYRVTRNPVVLFFIVPLYLFLIKQRFHAPKAKPQECRSVHAMNLAILGMAVCLSLLLGFKAYLIIQLSMLVVTGGAGVWLFYVQHQFEGVYWERREDWNFITAALEGSSFYKLPPVLQWFSGNIGFHHIHHLSPQIPNYNLEKCHNAIPLLQQVKPITLFSSFKSLDFRLWDEEDKKLVGYGALKKRRAKSKA